MRAKRTQIFPTTPTLGQTTPIFERSTLLRLHKRTNGKSSRADLVATQSHVDAQLSLESLYCNNTRLEMKGAEPPSKNIGGAKPTPMCVLLYNMMLVQNCTWTFTMQFRKCCAFIINPVPTPDVCRINLSATGTPTPSHGELSHSNKALTSHPQVGHCLLISYLATISE